MVVAHLSEKVERSRLSKVVVVEEMGSEGEEYVDDEEFSEEVAVPVEKELDEEG